VPGGKKPPHKREQAIAALISNGSMEKAAAATGVSEKTLRNWLAEPDFRRAYRQARRKLLDDAVLVLQSAAVTAVATLVKHMQGPKPEAAVRAAQIILDQCFRGTEILDIAEAIEQQVLEMSELRSHVEVMRRESRHVQASTARHENGVGRTTDDCGAESHARGNRAGRSRNPDEGGDDAGPLADDVAPFFP
jgi:hypothetical protein